MTAHPRLARATDAAQWLVGVAAATGVVLLFTLRGADSRIAIADAPAEGLYLQHCANCHGPQGEGGIGTRLADVVVALYPNPVDQERVISDGRNAMPSFAARLTEAEITSITTYTRNAWG